MKVKEVEIGLLFCRLWQLISHPDLAGLLLPRLLCLFNEERLISMSLQLKNKSDAPSSLSLTKNAHTQHSSLELKPQTEELKTSLSDEQHKLSLSVTVIEMW